MVRAWYMDDRTEDQRLEHQCQPPKFVSLDMLYKITGVKYFKVHPSGNDNSLEQLKLQRGYIYEDEIKCSPECLPDYEKNLKLFYQEHLHTEEEIRLILEGSGYFDVRDKDDEWIRIEVVPGDLIIIPEGIYHRFTLDSKNYVRAKRFFIGHPNWTAYYRPADDMDVRKQYLEKLQRVFL